jgi:glycosyltransferase involved in cell wall biosynthesis
MSPPRASVVLPTFNRPALLGRALASLALQTVADFEVIVVNDGGTDVCAVVEAWSPPLRIVHLPLPRNRGLSFARNTGIDRSTAPVVAFLDDDDLFLPHHLEAGLRALDETGAGVVYGSCLVCPRLVEPGAFPAPEDVLARFDIPFDARLLEICNFIPAISALCRGLRESGMRFDARAPVQEDWRMWLRLHDAGVPFAFLPEPTTVYQRVPGTGSMTNDTSHVEAATRRFETSYRRNVGARPSADPRVRLGRACYLRFEALRRARIRAGEPVPHESYERFLRVMVDYLASDGAEAPVLAAVDGIYARPGEEP